MNKEEQTCHCCGSVIEKRKLSDFNTKKEVREVINKIYDLRIKSPNVYKGTEEIVGKIKKGEILPAQDLKNFVHIINSRIEIQKNFAPFSALLTIGGIGVTLFIASLKGSKILKELHIKDEWIFITTFIIVLTIYPIFLMLVNSYYRYSQKMVFVKELIERAISELD
ncbi:hypothetical protein [Priestia megaterium]|uniref:hypothetical protein n=1 Tax=Priestia megaterium TaxID=1404 RepID=UPI0012B9122C|nr:hypothetical protein [Priestia megaterium]